MQDVREGRYPTDMEGFLHVLQDARSSLKAVIEGRGEHDLTELRDQGGWSVKDHLYHLAAWQRGMTFLLQKRPRHEGMGLDEHSYVDLDTDEMNDVIFRQSRKLPLAEVMNDFDTAHREMVNLLSSISFEDLQRPYAAYAPDDPLEDRHQPVLYLVFGNSAGHFAEHQEWIEEILGGSSEEPE